MSKITLSNISKSFQGRKILNNLSLTVREGELISLVGPSGCGKTTTLNIIAGLLNPDEGTICFNEMVMNHMAVEKRGAAVVDQDILLFPHMTVSDNISFGLRMAGSSRIKIRNKTEELIDLIQLGGHEKKFPSELSGGQQQRVAIARALAIEPRVLLLDEPFSRLDVSLRENMRQFVKEIHHRVKITTILVSHDIEETLTMSDRICLMMNGEIKQCDAPLEIYRRPASPGAARFLGFRNFLPGHLKDGIFHSALGSFPTPRGGTFSAEALIRPDQITLVPGDRGNLTGVLREITFAGGITRFTLETEGVILSGSSSSPPKDRCGDRVSFAVDFSDLVYYKRRDEDERNSA